MPDVTRRLLRSDDELAHRNAEQVLQSGVVESGVVSIRLKMSVFNNNNNNNLSCGNPQPEAIGHTRTCLQPESGGRHYAQSAASSTGK